MMESGLLLVDHQLIAALILFVVILGLHQLISVSTKREIPQHLMMVGTSVVYPLIVLILALTSSLLIYSVSVLIVLVHTVICYWFTVGWAQIENITVDLPSDITVLPQNYTLHAIKIGAYDRHYLKSANWYYESVNTSIELCTGHQYHYSCSVGDGEAVDYDNGKYDYTVTLTWSEENITSNGILHENGDLLYRFYLNFGVTRNRSQIVTGN